MNDSAELDQPTIEDDPPVVDEPVDENGRRRRRIALLLFLSFAATALLIFSGWYLLFRKPISEFPLPAITTEVMPGYDYSLYGARRPTGIAVTPDGSRIYVAQSEGDTAVLVFDARGGLITAMTPPDTGTDHVFVYVAIDPLSGDIYVSDRLAASIYIYSSDGEYRRAFAQPAALNGWQPLGLGFEADGHLFVTDANTGSVHEFAPDGSLLLSIGSPNQFSFPNGVIADRAGKIYVADSNNGRLVVLDENGAQLAVVRRGPGDGDVGMPRGLAIDDHDRLYVVDTTDQSVKVYRALGAGTGPPVFLGRFGTQGGGDGAFRFPNAVATDARGRVYVADWYNDRVQVWTY